MMKLIWVDLENMDYQRGAENQLSADEKEHKKVVGEIIKGVGQYMPLGAYIKLRQKYLEVNDE